MPPHPFSTSALPSTITHDLFEVTLDSDRVRENREPPSERAITSWDLNSSRRPSERDREPLNHEEPLHRRVRETENHEPFHERN
uniref:Uncharacterized protein n=1 Tax=Fagus sylvatica TaxID=28930 RepID=A0A2N9GI53_FAGSY